MVCKVCNCLVDERFSYCFTCREKVFIHKCKCGKKIAQEGGVCFLCYQSLLTHKCTGCKKKMKPGFDKCYDCNMTSRKGVSLNGIAPVCLI